MEGKLIIMQGESGGINIPEVEFSRKEFENIEKEQKEEREIEGLEIPIGKRINNEDLSSFPLASKVFDMSKMSVEAIKNWLKNNYKQLIASGFIVFVFSSADILLSVIFYKTEKKELKGKVYRYYAH